MWSIWRAIVSMTASRVRWFCEIPTLVRCRRNNLDSNAMLTLEVQLVRFNVDIMSWQHVSPIMKINFECCLPWNADALEKYNSWFGVFDGGFCLFSPNTTSIGIWSVICRVFNNSTSTEYVLATTHRGFSIFVTLDNFRLS